MEIVLLQCKYVSVFPVLSLLKDVNKQSYIYPFCGLHIFLLLDNFKQTWLCKWN